MPVIESQIDRNSEEFQRNRADMLEAIKTFRDAEETVRATAEKARDRFRKRGQLIPRERVELLLDRGAPFLELMPLADFPGLRNWGGHAAVNHGAGPGSNRGRFVITRSR